MSKRPSSGKLPVYKKGKINRDGPSVQSLWDPRTWFTPSGYNYLGPNPTPITQEYLDKYPPKNWLDAIAQDHDIHYQQLMDRGLSSFDVYNKAKFYDEIFIKAVEEHMKHNRVSIMERTVAYFAIQYFRVHGYAMQWFEVDQMEEDVLEDNAIEEPLLPNYRKDGKQYYWGYNMDNEGKPYLIEYDPDAPLYPSDLPGYTGITPTEEVIHPRYYICKNGKVSVKHDVFPRYGITYHCKKGIVL